MIIVCPLDSICGTNQLYRIQQSRSQRRLAAQLSNIDQETSSSFLLLRPLEPFAIVSIDKLGKENLQIFTCSKRFLKILHLFRQKSHKTPILPTFHIYSASPNYSIHNGKTDTISLNESDTSNSSPPFQGGFRGIKIRIERL